MKTCRENPEPRSGFRAGPERVHLFGERGLHRPGRNHARGGRLERRKRSASSTGTRTAPDQPDVVLASREEAAAIIARMKLGGSADNLTAGSEPFSDVSTDRWSAGYIAYCVSEGIVDGFEDGTFRPEEELTCYQFAKMLLVALGYDAGSEGLTGDSWATNTVSDAVNAGIFDDISSYSGSADRDTVAQMAFNTLLADLVEYPSGNIIIDLRRHQHRHQRLRRFPHREHQQHRRQH